MVVAQFLFFSVTEKMEGAQGFKIGPLPKQWNGLPPFLGWKRRAGLKSQLFV